MSTIYNGAPCGPASAHFPSRAGAIPVKITVMDYNESEFSEKEAASIDETFDYRDRASVTWINIDCIHDSDIIQSIGAHYNVHALVLEDIMHTGQRPKFEEQENCLYIVLKVLSLNSITREIDTEQMSMLLLPGSVITFQETPGDIFDVVRDRIRKSGGRIRKMGSDYLAYSLMDAIIDNYFVVLETVGDELEALEETISGGENDAKSINDIHRIKREMIFMRKSVWPLRDLVNGLVKTESDLIKDSTKFYLKDIYDHTIQVMDNIESFRDLCAGLLDEYLSYSSRRMNEVMKVLTIVSTIFMPLTFLAGLYGMNFKHMPELEWEYGFYAELGAMGFVTLAMYWMFKIKKWI